MAMSAQQRVEIEDRLGPFAEMDADQVAAWFKQQEDERIAEAKAQCERRGAHLYMWSSSECLKCGEPYED